ncbi:DNA-directed RNA polymerase II subunit H [Perkinsela sp. CCAP 1560/4]|nr:DNA-directed RNA polymerase II subunit H [Perkinsela sp. CCAP 1560/4]|eukprot:KNH08284.1 DNA-directed RNA polymerase II subunit H [Perkinsela sp. CCAP 1560/4]
MKQEELFPPPLLFEDMFTISEIEKKFDKVSRIKAHSQIHQMSCCVDINTEIYPVSIGESYTIALSMTVEYTSNPDLTVEALASQAQPKGGQRYDPRIFNRTTLLDHYDYVMFGRVYGCSTEDQNAGDNAAVYISFGGLLMQLKGSTKALENIKYGIQVYFLMNRVRKDIA